MSVTDTGLGCFGIPAEVVHADDGQVPDGTVGRVPVRVVADPPTGVDTAWYGPAVTVMPEAVVNDVEAGLIATLTSAGIKKESAGIGHS